MNHNVKNKKLDSKYHELNIKANIIYKFVTTYSDYMKAPHDYGTGEEINMAEVHLLTLISEKPGITVTEAALDWKRTKGAISQIISKLVNRGLIFKNKEEGNAKSIHLYVTARGKVLSDAHKKYDINELTWADTMLKKKFTEVEVENFYKIMDMYTELLNM